MQNDILTKCPMCGMTGCDTYTLSDNGSSTLVQSDDCLRRQAGYATGIEAEVCEDISRRQALGVKKYGVTVADNPLSLREWLEHAYQECLDQAVYLKRAIKELPPE